MPIHIKEINIEALGPLANFQMQMGLVNLIYGRNEQGKTYLVEFLIRSLFKKPDFQFLRQPDVRGEVRLSGIKEDIVSFTLKSKLKLGDYLAPGAGSLPPSLARLLVVRAGELAIAQSVSGGADRAILKQYLSNDDFLESVRGNISRTIQAARLGSGGEINGKNDGEIETRNILRDKLKSLDSLFGRLQEIYSGGQRAALDLQLKETRANFERMERARCFMAWKVAGQIAQINLEKEKLTHQDLNDLEQDLRQFHEHSTRLIEKQKLCSEKEAACVNYPWLVEAIDIYKNCSTQLTDRPGLVLPTVVGVALLSAVVFGFIGLPIGTLLAVVVAGILSWLYLRQTMALVTRAADLKERERIVIEYSNRFEAKFSGLPAMEELRKKLEPEALKAKLLKDDIDKETLEIEKIKAAITDKLLRLTGQPLVEEHWEETSENLKNRLNGLENQLLLAERECARLNVAASFYVVENPGVDFDLVDHTRQRGEIDRLAKELKEQTDALSDLKRDVANEVDGDLSNEWEDLICKLKAKRFEIAQKYRATTSKILAGILVVEALTAFRQEEDQHIRQGLQSGLVTEPLLRLTGRYDQLDLEGDQLKVADSIGSFSLAELSTGAQEQVLLALRIGFARKLMGQDALFLILDDAFQHSDWLRREKLVDEMISLTQQGWQILYFSMDDHIRDLFESRVKPVLGEDYCYRELVTRKE